MYIFILHFVSISRCFSVCRTFFCYFVRFHHAREIYTDHLLSKDIFFPTIFLLQWVFVIFFSTQIVNLLNISSYDFDNVFINGRVTSSGLEQICATNELPSIQTALNSRLIYDGRIAAIKDTFRAIFDRF